jgi:hypothetical protein
MNLYRKIHIYLLFFVHNYLNKYFLNSYKNLYIELKKVKELILIIIYYNFLQT